MAAERDRHRVCDLADVAVGQVVITETRDGPVAVFRTPTGLYALARHQPVQRRVSPAGVDQWARRSTEELALLREIGEEVGAQMRDVRYLGSQAWPSRAR